MKKSSSLGKSEGCNVVELKLNYITSREAAGLLKRDQRTVQRWVKEGRIKSYRLYGRILIDRRDFDEFQARMMRRQ